MAGLNAKMFVFIFFTIRCSSGYQPSFVSQIKQFYISQSLKTEPLIFCSVNVISKHLGFSMPKAHHIAVRAPAPPQYDNVLAATEKTHTPTRCT